MAEIAWDWQLDADAVRAKGEATVAPLAGLLTVIPAEVVLAATGFVGVDATTVTATSVTQTPPWLFHAFTWMV